jgi:nicotinamidase-related amidase
VPENNLPRKERYFDQKNIDTVSQTILSELRSKVRIHDLEFAPDRSALIVLDMQKIFLDDGSHAFLPSAEAITPRIVGLMEMFKRIGRPVITTRHLNTIDDSGMMSVWWRDMIQEDDPLSELIKEIDHQSATTIIKAQYDAFLGTDLEKMLQDSGTDQVVVVGVMTHLCCETTVRSAFMRGFTVFMPVDGTATYNIDFHRAAMLNLSHGFAVPTLVDRASATW